MAAIFAIKAGLRDAREGRPAYFWAIFSDPSRRGELLRERWKAVSKVFIYRSRGAADGDDPASASTEDPQAGIRKNLGVDSGNSCRINFSLGAYGDPRGDLSAVVVTGGECRGLRKCRGTSDEGN